MEVLVMNEIELMYTRPCEPQFGNISDLDPSWNNTPVIDCSQWECPDVIYDFTIYDVN